MKVSELVQRLMDFDSTLEVVYEGFGDRDFDGVCSVELGHYAPVDGSGIETPCVVLTEREFK